MKKPNKFRVHLEGSKLTQETAENSKHFSLKHKIRTTKECIIEKNKKIEKAKRRGSMGLLLGLNRSSSSSQFINNILENNFNNPYEAPTGSQTTKARNSKNQNLTFIPFIQELTKNAKNYIPDKPSTEEENLLKNYNQERFLGRHKNLSNKGTLNFI